VSSQIILQPIGIVTQPNKLGSIPPGAFARADYAYMRSPGEVEASGQWSIQVSKTSGISVTPTAYVISPGRSQALALFQGTSTTQWNLAWYDAMAGTISTSLQLVTASSITQQIDSLGRVGWATSNGHTVVSCALGVVAFDYATPSSNAERAPRMAGMYPMTYMTGSASAATSGSGALAQNTHCHVVAVVRRRFADGYELVSSPTAALHAETSTTGAADNYISLFIGFDNRFVVAGDVIEVYRTRAQQFTGSPSYTRVNTGSDYYLSKSYTLTSSDVSSTFVSINDYTPDAALGEALYTNDGVQGAEASALVPPTCSAVAAFRGYTFYFGNVDPPHFSLRNPTCWGLISGTAPQGVRNNAYGQLLVTGTFTSGSPTITGLPAGVTDNIVTGQAFTSSSLPAGYATYVSKTATTVTVSANATATGSATLSVYDVVEIDGTRCPSADVTLLALYAGVNYTVSCLSRIVTSVDTGFGNPLTVPADKVIVTKKSVWGDPTSSPTMSVRATRGNILEPPLPRIENAESARVYSCTTHSNGFMWSEENQPENVPATNAAFCGKGTIYGGYSTRDALWIFASDGLWRLSGTGGQAGRGYDWRLDPVDSTLILSGPQAACVLRDKVYAMTSRGFVSIDSDGSVSELSHGLVDDLLLATGWPASTVTYDTTGSVFLVPDETNNEVLIKQRSESDTLKLWRYNASTGAFTKDTTPTSPIHGVFFDYSRTPLLLQVSSGRIDFLTQSTSSFNVADLTYQPIFGSGPFDMHHWQTVNVAAESNTASLSVYAGTTLIGTRSMIAGDSSIYSRRSFGVPRSAPAVSNNLQLRIVGGSSSQQFKLLGVEVVHEQLTGQRKDR